MSGGQPRAVQDLFASMAIADERESRASEPTLSFETLSEIDGFSDTLVTLISPSDVAVLAACSSALRAAFDRPRWWARQLNKHYGWNISDALRVDQPKQAFAQATVCARWGLPLPRAASDKRALVTPTRTGRGDRTRRGVEHEPGSLGAAPFLSGGSSAGSTPLYASKRDNKENVRPVRNQRLSGGAGLSAPDVTPTPAGPADPLGASPSSSSSADSADAAPPATPAGALRTRLLAGLQQVMLGEVDGVSACPLSPGDWSRWTARVDTMPPLEQAAAAAPSAGVQLTLNLEFELEGEGAGGLPAITVTRPACKHPNIGSDGTVCASALARRCPPVALVGEVLASVRNLLETPVLSVQPLNADAAARWFGEGERFARGCAGRLLADAADATPRQSRVALCSS